MNRKSTGLVLASMSIFFLSILGLVAAIEVSPVGAALPSVIRTISAGGQIVVSPDSSTAWISGGNEVNKVNAASGAITGTVTGQNGVFQSAISPDG